jgi:DNA-binding NarL/FixJ family response regulator
LDLLRFFDRSLEFRRRVIQHRRRTATYDNMNKKTVLLIDDHEALLDSTKEFLELLVKVNCLCFLGLKELASGWADVSKAAPSLAILDINLGAGEPSGVDVYHWLHAQGHAKDHPLVKQAVQINGVKVFEKPMGIDDLTALVRES